MEKEIIFHGEKTDISLIHDSKQNMITIRMSNNNGDVSESFTYDQAYDISRALIEFEELED